MRRQPKLMNPPNGRWREQWAKLMRDSWLAKKLDRKRRINEHYSYLEKYVPEFWNFEPGFVVDIGPGGGELLEIARAEGHQIIGYDAPTIAGGMGAAYLQASELMHQRQLLPVLTTGLGGFLDRHLPVGIACLINARGSLEMCFSNYMSGPPHHLHHDCKKLSWLVNDELNAAFQAFMEATYVWLRKGGILLIHANGSQNDSAAFHRLKCAARDAGLTPQATGSKDERIMKWTKNA